MGAQKGIHRLIWSEPDLPDHSGATRFALSPERGAYTLSRHAQNQGVRACPRHQPLQAVLSGSRLHPGFRRRGVAYFHFGAVSFLLQDHYHEALAEHFMMLILMKDVAAWWAHGEESQITPVTASGSRRSPPSRGT